MFRKPAVAALVVGSLVLARGFGCSPDFEFPEPGEAGGATSSMGGSLVASTTTGEAGGSFDLGGAAGEAQSSTDTEAGGTGGQGGSGPYDTGDEDCTNGMDDDLDGAADCEDEKCQPYFRCLPPVPDGWQGPVAIWEGSEWQDSTDSLPGCAPAGYYPQGFETIGTRVLSPPEPSTCPTCSCEPSADATCSTVDVSYYTSADCTGAATVVTAGEMCSSETLVHAGADRPQSARFTAPLAGGSGACTPVQTGSRSTPPADRVRVRSCGGPSLDGVGCGDSELCLPRPLAPFNAAVCIFMEGEADCPTGYEMATEPYFSTVQDSRSCRQCACTSPRCAGAVSDHVDDTECTGASTELSDGDCVTIEPDDTDPDVRSVSWNVAAGATCTPRQGPIGDYVLSDPLTYCCFQF